ncbi:MAG: hypothetical protein IT247_05735 [Bacteroidia bacterium]|nr:hypothetical protein [Bacteroidia bacterium]
MKTISLSIALMLFLLLSCKKESKETVLTDAFTVTVQCDTPAYGTFTKWEDNNAYKDIIYFDGELLPQNQNQPITAFTDRPKGNGYKGKNYHIRIHTAKQAKDSLRVTIDALINDTLRHYFFSTPKGGGQIDEWF